MKNCFLMNRKNNIYTTQIREFGSLEVLLVRVDRKALVLRFKVRSKGMWQVSEGKRRWYY